jgi:hypothetical protein
MLRHCPSTQTGIAVVPPVTKVLAERTVVQGMHNAYVHILHTMHYIPHTARAMLLRFSA